MEKNRDNYCVILAGGKGRRLWPYSRDKYPKQFIDFFGYGRTQLQLTFDRFAKILPKENIFVCTNEDYASLVKEQLPDIPEENMVVEPVNRNTAPSVAWADMRICQRNPKANIIVSPSDQFIFNEEAFTNNVMKGFDFVSKHDMLLTMGVKPTRPEPGYGYIQIGDLSDTKDVYKVQSFTEKPDRDFAKVFVESGEFYWNTGLFLSNASSFLKSFNQLFVEMQSTLESAKPNYTLEDSIEFISTNYPSFPNLSIDYGVLEQCDNVFLMKCDFGWADLGTWHSIYECMSKGEGDNVVVDSDVILENCRNNMIKLPKNRLAVINGLDGYIVVEKGDVLFICKKGDSSALVRKYVNEVQMKYGDEYI